MERMTKLGLVFTGLFLVLVACNTSTVLPGQDLVTPGVTVPGVTATPAPTALPTLSSRPADLPPALDPVSLQDTLVGLYEQVSPGVVAIRMLNTSSGSLGSGFVIDADGHIVTNYHVVEDEDEVEVAFPSGLKTRGRVIGIDPDSDLAVVKVTAPAGELHPLVLGDSDQARVGQLVVAVGNPFGLERTMTIGIISGLGRTIRSQRILDNERSAFTVGDVIQTDAAINPGNSGGPLLNLNGEVIGVNESILTSPGESSNSGVGFAISVNMVKRIVPALIATGRYEYPYLGIYSIGELTLLDQEALQLPRTTGVYITQVEPGGPADRAGIQAGTRNSRIPGVPAGGDLIIAVDGQPVFNFNDLIVYITKNKRPGDTIVLTILRGEDQIELTLTLDRRPGL
jgi:2-alkenal reductase